jgi:hypothetical protein
VGLVATHFAGLMAGLLLLAPALTCRLALLAFVGWVLRVVAAARLANVAVVGALLFCTGAAPGWRWSAPCWCG